MKYHHLYSTLILYKDLAVECVDLNLDNRKKSPLMMASSIMNDISTVINFYFWQPVYYLLDSTEQFFTGKSKEMRERWTGVLQ